MKKTNSSRPVLLAAVSLGLIGVAACDQPTPAESAGKKIDQAMEKMSQKVEQTAERAKEQATRAGQAIDDVTITAAVKAAILAEPGLKVMKIDVHTRDGTVTLTGSTDSQERLERATTVAGSVEGVKLVDNRIAVSTRG
jgi:hyperosmotically inducible periplasmic protein